MLGPPLPILFEAVQIYSPVSDQLTNHFICKQFVIKITNFQLVLHIINIENSISGLKLYDAFWTLFIYHCINISLFFILIVNFYWLLQIELGRAKKLFFLEDMSPIKSILFTPPPLLGHLKWFPYISDIKILRISSNFPLKY